MGVRELQALAAEAKALPCYEASGPTVSVQPALAKKIQALRATVANSADTNSHAAKTVAVMNDLEKALQERTGELDKISRNYGGLHSICEEYHEQLDALRDQLACGGEPDEMRRLKQRELELGRRVEDLTSELRDAQRELTGLRAELSNANTSVHESNKEKKKLQAFIQAAQAAAGRGGDQLTSANAANSALKEELQAALASARKAEAQAERAEAELAQASSQAERQRSEAARLQARAARDQEQAITRRGVWRGATCCPHGHSPI